MSEAKSLAQASRREATRRRISISLATNQKTRLRVSSPAQQDCRTTERKKKNHPQYTRPGSPHSKKRIPLQPENQQNSAPDSLQSTAPSRSGKPPHPQPKPDPRPSPPPKSNTLTPPPPPTPTPPPESPAPSPTPPKSTPPSPPNKPLHSKAHTGAPATSPHTAPSTPPISPPN